MLSAAMASYDFSAPRLYVPSDLDAGTVLVIEQDQRNYLCNVLRLKEGSDVLVFNGRDGEWRASLGLGTGKGAARRQAMLTVSTATRPQTPPDDLHYLFAPLKHARLDYMVQKAVEMGATVLRPVLTRRTQVARINNDRLRANAIEAAEQCGILALPRIETAESLDAVLSRWDDKRTLVFCDEDAEARDPLEMLRSVARNTPVAVLIGPEGGFDPMERAALLALPNVVRLSLGPRILRADTAAVAALALIQAAIGGG